MIEEVSLPRILTAVLVGMALGTAGATMQGLFRNPMADPGIIGVSSGGAIAAILAIVTGLQTVSISFLPVAAFFGAAGAGFVVYTIASIGGRSDMASLLLTGIAVSPFLGACISLVILKTRNL